MRLTVPAFLALLTAALPLAAAAQDSGRHAWGVPASRAGQSVLTVAPCESPCVAVVTFNNTLVVGAFGGVTEEATLSLGGVLLAISVAQHGGTAPDTLRVLPPLGYVAEPRELPVVDGARGAIKVALLPMS